MQQKCKWQTHLPYLHSRNVCIFKSACSLAFTVFQSIFSKLAVINECRKVSHWNKKLMSDSYKNQEPGWAPVKTQRMTPVESPVGSRSQIILAVFFWKIDESYARNDECCQKLC